MFKLKSQTAYLKHVSPNKEKAGKDPDGPLAATLSFKLTDVPAAILKPLAPSDGDSGNIVDSIFDEKGVPRFRDGWGTLNFAAIANDAAVTVSGKTYRGSKLKDFIVTRATGGKKVDLEFKAIVHPTEEQVGQLCGKMKQNVTIGPGRAGSGVIRDRSRYQERRLHRGPRRDRRHAAPDRQRARQASPDSGCGRPQGIRALAHA